MHFKSKLILFSQHGMTDNNEMMEALAYRVAPPQSLIIAPNLGYINSYYCSKSGIY